MQRVAHVSPVHVLGAFCGSVPPQAELKKSKGYFFKEAQAAPLHERGPAAMSDKNFCYLRGKNKEYLRAPLRAKYFTIRIIYVAPLELKTTLKSDFYISPVRGFKKDMGTQ